MWRENDMASRERLCRILDHNWFLKRVCEKTNGTTIDIFRCSRCGREREEIRDEEQNTSIGL